MQLHELPQRAERVSVHLTVKVVVGESAYRAELINLSLSGAFLEASFPVGTGLELHLPLPGGEPMRLRAKVVRQGWSQKFIDQSKVDNLAIRALGVGVAFEEVEDPDAQRLQDYMDLVIDRS